MTSQPRLFELTFSEPGGDHLPTLIGGDLAILAQAPQNGAPPTPATHNPHSASHPHHGTAMASQIPTSSAEPPRSELQRMPGLQYDPEAEYDVTPYAYAVERIRRGSTDLPVAFPDVGYAVRDVVEAQFLGAIGAIAQLVVVGYNLFGNPTDPIPRALNTMLGVMDAVNGRIEAVQRRLSAIVSQIEKMEREIKGHIDFSFTQQALGRIDGLRYNLQDLMRDETAMRRELPRVKGHMDELLNQLTVVRQFTGGGIAGTFAMAPGIALWSQVYMAVQRVEAVALTHTVWDHQFHKDCISMFEQVFQADLTLQGVFAREKSEFPQWSTGGLGRQQHRINRFEPPSARHPRGRFVDTGLTKDWNHLCAPAPQATDHFYLLYDSDRQHQLHWPQRRPCLPGDRPIWTWSFVSEPQAHPNPVLASQAYALLQHQEEREAAHAQHASLMRNAPYYRSLITRYCATKPAQWGGTGAPAEPMVHLYNASWDKVNVEVRRGLEADCARNAAFETRALDRGELWPIPVPDVDLCYRRDVDPDQPNGQWTPFRHEQFMPDQPDRLVTIR